MKIQSNSQSVTKEMQIKAMRKVLPPFKLARRTNGLSSGGEDALQGNLLASVTTPSGFSQEQPCTCRQGSMCRTRVQAAGFQNEPPQHGSLLHEDYFELKAVKTLQVQREQRQNIIWHKPQKCFLRSVSQGSKNNSKSKQMGPNLTYNLLQRRRNQEKTIYRMGENICK